MILNYLKNITFLFQEKKTKRVIISVSNPRIEILENQEKDKV